MVVAASALIGARLLSSPPDPQAAAPPPPGAGPAMLAGRAPDISNLTPRQRFDRLYQRVMDAAGTGDTGTVLTFTRHAITAYAQLDSVDADARYHLAILYAQVGEFPPALALADSILMIAPSHLLGLLALGTVAELAGDRVSLERIRARFLNAWDAERQHGRAEYLDHPDVLEDFRRAAIAAGPPAPDRR